MGYQPLLLAASGAKVAANFKDPLCAGQSDRFLAHAKTEIYRRGQLMNWAIRSRYDFETLLEIEAELFRELSHRKQQRRRRPYTDKRRRTPKTSIAGYGIAGRRNHHWNP
jgi:hypothetical protein